MNSLKPQDAQARHQLLKLKKQMESIHNEMEFVEILAQFWPWPNMSERVERLQEKLDLLALQCRQDSNSAQSQVVSNQLASAQQVRMSQMASKQPAPTQPIRMSQVFTRPVVSTGWNFQQAALSQS